MVDGLPTAAATPQPTAKPRPRPVPSFMLSAGSSWSWEKSTSLASNMPWSSSKVSTKSSSERTDFRLASSFLAEQGPMKQIRALGWSFFTIRAVMTMGVRAMEMHSLNSGKSFLAMTDQAGQQLGAHEGQLLRHLSRKSLASSTVQRSAPMATSTTSAKPRIRMAAFSRAGVASLPNWPTKAGATQAMTSSSAAWR